MAKLFFRYGAMNCGKTTQLLQVAHNYEERGMKVVILKPEIDTKGNDTVVSRLGVSRKVDHIIKKDENIFNLFDFQSPDFRYETDCVLVDEVQFLTKKQIDELMDIVTIYKIPVICYGLRTDFTRNGFEGSSRLLEIAHEIEELKTICHCGRKAIFNIRKVNDKVVFDGEQVCIDNRDDVEYEAVCNDCYYAIKK
ncbi:MAG: thymidine kinase [Clostridia bacterium]|nr:thymidine kinase [Clostridia bacterium]